jgi:vesicle-associated membrane protein 2
MQQSLAQKRMAQQQAQVDQVVNIMRSNVEKVIDRDENLLKMNESAEKLESGASQFEMHMGKLKKKFNWRANSKWILLCALSVLAIALLVYLEQRTADPGPTPTIKPRISAPEEVLETKETAMLSPYPNKDTYDTSNANNKTIANTTNNG